MAASQRTRTRPSNTAQPKKRLSKRSAWQSPSTRARLWCTPPERWTRLKRRCLREVTEMAKDAALRQQLLALLKEGGAHVSFESAIKGLPVSSRGKKPTGAGHSLWEILEHMRIAQWDILEFSRDPKHVSPKWPEGYWPEPDPPSGTAWAQSTKAFRRDLKAMQDLVSDPSTDLLAPIPHGEGQTILRETLLVADHNSYHLGQLVLVRRLLGEWQD